MRQYMQNVDESRIRNPKSKIRNRKGWKMKVAFSPEAQKEFDELITRYPDNKSPLLMVLHLAQREFGWLSKNVMEYVGELLKLPYSEVLDTASFYTMFKLKPTGKYHLQVCN